MKIVTLLAASLMAPAALATEANLYLCKGDGVEVKMTLSSISGEPTLKVDATSEESSNAPGGRLEKVTLADTAMGHEVTGEFVEIADATLKYTLIVPHVVVNDAKPVFTTSGMLVRTMVAGFIPPNGQMPRVVEGNQFTPVVCEANKVLY